jgi:hypothetical protein
MCKTAGETHVTGLMDEKQLASDISSAWDGLAHPLSDACH